MKKWILQIWNKIPMDRIKEHPLVVRVVSVYDELPPQRKKFVQWGAIGGSVLLLLLLIQSSFSYLDRLKQDIEYKRKEIVNLALEYDQYMTDHKQFLDDLQRKIHAQDKWIPKEFLTDFFNKSGISDKNIESIEDTPNRTFENMQEFVSKVVLKEVSLKQVTLTLSNLTKTNRVISLQNVSMEKTGGNNLRVQMHISSLMKR